MKQIKSKSFSKAIEVGTYGGGSFSECFFDNCFLSTSKIESNWTTIRRVDLTDCTSMSCSIGPCFLENVTITNLKTNNLLQVFGAAFKHVSIHGKIGRVMIVPYVVDCTPEEQAAIDSIRAKYYRKVDWAIDISDAEFTDLDLTGVPARLVRRNPEWQVLVTRERAMRVKWTPRTREEKYWSTMIQLFLDDPREPGRKLDEVVLVAPRNRKKDYVKGLMRLREKGIAEPD